MEKLILYCPKCKRQVIPITKWDEYFCPDCKQNLNEPVIENLVRDSSSPDGWIESIGIGDLREGDQVRWGEFNHRLILYVYLGQNYLVARSKRQESLRLSGTPIAAGDYEDILEGYKFWYEIRLKKEQVKK